MDQAQNYLNEFEEALLEIDRIETKNIIKELNKFLTPFQIVEGLIVPVLENIGKKWENGKIALSQVYLSGRICEELVDWLLPLRTSIRKKYPKIAIVVLEDYHVLGKRIVTSIVRAACQDLTDYGHGVSVDEIIARLRVDKIDILLISTLMLSAAMHVKDLTNQMKKLKINTKTIVGGAPFRFDDQLWKDVGADAMCKEASEVIETIVKIIGEKDHSN